MTEDNPPQPTADSEPEPAEKMVEAAWRARLEYTDEGSLQYVMSSLKARLNGFQPPVSSSVETAPDTAQKGKVLPFKPPALLRK